MNLTELQKEFCTLLQEKLASDGYVFCDGEPCMLKKITKNRVFVIEPMPILKDGSLTAEIKVADVKIKNGLFKKSIPAESVTTKSVKDRSEGFVKKLSHFDRIPVNDEVNGEQLKELANACLVCKSVCENNKIDKEYDKLLKSDMPFKTALYFTFLSSLIFFFTATVAIGLAGGIAVYFIFGFEKFWGLFTAPFFYLFMLVPTAVYALVCFPKIRRGRL